MGPGAGCVFVTQVASAANVTTSYRCTAPIGKPPPAPPGPPTCKDTLQNQTIIADWRATGANRPFWTAVVDTYDDCCLACSSKDQCGVWTWQFSNKVCHLAVNGTAAAMCDCISARRAMTPPPSPAPLSFYVAATWSVNPGRLVAEKHLEISIPSVVVGSEATTMINTDDDPAYTPSFTIRSVSLLDNVTVTQAGKVFAGSTIAYNAVDDFHNPNGNQPLTLKNCHPSCYIAAFYRGDTAGAFVSVANPYSNYSSEAGTSTGIAAWYEPDFLYAPGVRSAPATYATEPVVLGLTVLEPYWISQGRIPAAASAVVAVTANLEREPAAGSLGNAYERYWINQGGIPAAISAAEIWAAPTQARRADGAVDTCTNSTLVHQMDTSGQWLGQPLTNLSAGEAGAEQCRALCCETEHCLSYTYAWQKSSANQTFCYLKDYSPVAPSPNCGPTDAYECYSGVTCKPSDRRAGYDLPGYDIQQIPNVDEPTCVNECCVDAACTAYTFLPAAPFEFGACIQDKPCCFMKAGAPVFSQNGDAGIVSAHLRPGPPAPAPPPPPGPPPIMPPSPFDINQGEWRAFTKAVETFLLDGGVSRKPVRVQVGWDSNDYQMDVANETEWAEYQRLLTIAAEMGITHTTFAPRNTKQSLRANATDAWQWEECLWLTLGEKIREGRWLPGRDPVPADIARFVAFAENLGIKFLAYAYPTLGLTGPGAFPINEGWLFNKTFHPQPWQVKSNLAASLADPMYQDYFAKLLIDFMTTTGAGGYAWDYGINGDWRQPSTYPEWRGWMRILKQLREAHPDAVMDHRQTAHNWGPWYQLAGSYTEPISGDENPESYGAAGHGAVPTLSTDHVLADNLRRVNFVYRARQLIPNHRVPGFMFHQSERSNNTGPPNGPGDGIATLVWDHDIHTRDFDRLGFKYSVMSSIGTAGLNNVLAMLPGRDPAVFAKFPDADKAFVKRWLVWAELNMQTLANTQVIASLMTDDAAGGKPGMDRIDGVAAFSDSGETGYLFVFNPGPTRPAASITIDQAVGIQPRAGAARQWVVHEVFPREELNGTTTPVAVVAEGMEITVAPRGNKALALRLTQIVAQNGSDARQEQRPPIVLGASYTRAAFEGATLTMDGVSGLTGTTDSFEALLPIAPGANISVIINGKPLAVSVPTAACDAAQIMVQPQSCATFHVGFAGDVLTEMMPVSDVDPEPAAGGGWYNASFRLSPGLWAQRQARQAEFDIDWVADDMDAPWLGNRLLMYPYILQPQAPSGPVVTDFAAVSAGPPPPSPGWVTMQGYACDIGSAPVFAKAGTTDAECLSLCQKTATCVEWLLDKGGMMCYGYNIHNEPGANPGYDCGCKGSCSGAPPPPPPGPGPPGPPAQASPRLWIDGKEVPVVPAYNSRGHIYPKCFMGFYWNATEFVEANAAAGGEHTLQLKLPALNVTGGQSFVNVYWHGTEDQYTTAIATA